MKNELKPLLTIIFISVIVFFGIVYISSSEPSPNPDKVDPESKITNDLTSVGEEMPYLGADHITRGTMPVSQDLPASGPHYGDGVAGPGIHDEPVDDGLLVHSLEHGAVVLSYDRTRLNEGQIIQLKAIFNNKLEGKKIMVPRDNMSSSIIMTAWNKQLKLNEIDEEQIIIFMIENNDKGPEKSPHY